jgi:Ca2+-binding EF-hand superfamily protein
MGVVFGRPLLADGAVSFVNLPREAIESLWTSYNLLGEGWGLSIDDVRNIFSGASYVTENVGFSDDSLKALFAVFDTDKNDLIDALELFITLALASGMDTIDKISFVFSAFDLGGRDSLSFDGNLQTRREITEMDFLIHHTQTHTHSHTHTDTHTHTHTHTLTHITLTLTLTHSRAFSSS